MQLLTLLASASVALAGPVLHERAGTPVVPVQIPTGTACAGVPQSPTVSPADRAAAYAPCQNVQPLGTNFTRNDISDGICKPLTFLFARGTTEDPNLGNIVGPPFLAALEKAFGGAKNVAVQGVNNYAAIGAEYCAGGSLTAAQDLANSVVLAQQRCPKTKLLVSGYSQGAQVVHNGIQLLANNAKALAFINSVVTFGDPDRNVPFPKGLAPNKVKIECNAGDNICDNGSNVLVPHLTYCRNVARDAAFVLARSKAKN